VRGAGAALALAAALVAGCAKPEPKEPEPAAAAEPAAPRAAPKAAAGYTVVESVAGAGSVSGTIRLEGPVPKLQSRPVTNDVKGCGGGTDRSSQALLLGKEKGIANVVVRLEGVTRGRAFGPGPYELDQKSCVFTPHLLIVPRDVPVTFVNSDPVGHNVHAYDRDNTSLFNLGTPIQGTRLTETFGVPGPIRIKCDLHNWMAAWIWVASTPYAVATDVEGRFTLDGVPPGSYRLSVWHELLGEKEVPVTVAPGTTATADLTLSVMGS